MKRFIIIAFLLGINIICFATKYYVKNGGKDSYSGLDDANAWANHPWMMAWTGSIVLAPGDTVYMKKGNIWSIANPSVHLMTVDQNGTAGSPITTSSYGTGAAPIIKISTATNKSVIYASGKSYIVFDNLHIQHHSGSFYEGYRNGIELDGSTAACHHITITNCIIDSCPFYGIFGYMNCHHIIVGDTTATHIATSAKYNNHIYNFGYAGVGLQGVNPVNNESHFYVYYNYIHDATRTFIGDNEYGIILSANSSSKAWPKYCYASFNRVENINTWEGIECHGGSYIYFQDNHVINFGTAGIWAGGTSLGSLPATCDHIYIDRNIIEQSNTAKGGGSFILQSSPSKVTIPSNIFIRNNVLFYSSRPISGGFYGIRVGNINGLIINGNKIYNGATESGAAGIYLTDNYATFGNKNVTITKNFIYQWGPGINLEGSAITGKIRIINNIVVKPTGNSCLILTSNNLSPTSEVTIYNNVLLADDHTRCFQTSYGISSGGSVIAKNNIMGWLGPKGGYYWEWQGAISGTFTCDYNLYWNSVYINPFNLEVKDHSWKDWNEHGYDLHSLYNTDPIFYNTSGLYSQFSDFELQYTSPAINAGTDVGLTTDIVGTAILGLPDIGAFETPPVEIITSSPVEGFLYKENNVNLIYILRGRFLFLDNSYFILNAGKNQYFTTSSGTIPLNSNEGLNRLEIYAKDLAGNSSTKTINYTLDRNPVIIITSSPRGDSIYKENDAILEYILRDTNLDLKNSFYKLNSVQDYFNDSTGTILLNSIVGFNKLEMHAKDLAGNISSKTINYTYSPNSGIAEIQEIEFHPNPINKIVKLYYPEGETVYINLYNVSGIMLMEFKDDDKNGETYVDLSNLAPGLFIFKLHDEAGTILYGKVVKN